MLPYDDLSGGCYKETDYFVGATLTVFKSWQEKTTFLVVVAPSMNPLIQL